MNHMMSTMFPYTCTLINGFTLFIFSAQLVMVSSDRQHICSTVMEETGSLGADVLIDNGGITITTTILSCMAVITLQISIMSANQHNYVDLSLVGVVSEVGGGSASLTGVSFYKLIIYIGANLLTYGY